VYIVTKNNSFMPLAPIKYTKTIQVMVSDIQSQTLAKMKNRNVKIPQFIRDAIKEKIQRDYKELKPKEKKEHLPF
jgi:hypothetical protein